MWAISFSLVSTLFLSVDCCLPSMVSVFSSSSSAEDDVQSEEGGRFHPSTNYYINMFRCSPAFVSYHTLCHLSQSIHCENTHRSHAQNRTNLNSFLVVFIARHQFILYYHPKVLFFVFPSSFLCSATFHISHDIQAFQ